MKPHLIAILLLLLTPGLATGQTAEAEEEAPGYFEQRGYFASDFIWNDGHPRDYGEWDYSWEKTKQGARRLFITLPLLTRHPSEEARKHALWALNATTTGLAETFDRTVAEEFRNFAWFFTAPPEEIYEAQRSWAGLTGGPMPRRPPEDFGDRLIALIDALTGGPSTEETCPW